MRSLKLESVSTVQQQSTGLSSDNTLKHRKYKCLTPLVWCRIFVTTPQSNSAAQRSYFLFLIFAVTLPLPRRYFFRGQRVAVHEPESLMQMATHAVLSSDGMCLSIHVHNFAYAGWLPEYSAGKCYKSNKATAQLTRTHTVTVPAYAWHP